MKKYIFQQKIHHYLRPSVNTIIFYAKPVVKLK